jgi:phosphatidate cytidylyltransferase
MSTNSLAIPLLIKTTLKRAISGIAILTIFSLAIYSKATFSLLVSILFTISIFEVFETSHWKLKVSGIIAIIISFIMLELHILQGSLNEAINIFINASLHDTGGYIFGSLFGKTKIAPDTSPKKTLEGFIGSILTIYMFDISLSNTLFSTKHQTSHIISMAKSVLYASISLTGDLFFSKIKRLSKIKDFGSIIPGHGGVLDRIDSTIALSIYFGITSILL